LIEEIYQEEKEGHTTHKAVPNCNMRLSSDFNNRKRYEAGEVCDMSGGNRKKDERIAQDE
jgi:hypothetical protein